MQPRHWWVGVGALLVGLMCGFGSGFVLGTRSSRPKPPDLNDPSLWIPIKVYQGMLDPMDGEIHVSVSVVLRISNGEYPYTIYQNKIEIRKGDATYSFLWPDDKTYAAGWCEIADVDGDGRKEFLMYAGTQAVRIVSFSGGQFLYRQKLDELSSLGYDIGPSDHDNNKKLEFLQGVTFPPDYDIYTKTIYIPRVKQWSRAAGFHDVSEKFADYYKKEVLADLEKQLAANSDPQRRETILQGLEYVKRELIKR